MLSKHGISFREIENNFVYSHHKKMGLTAKTPLARQDAALFTTPDIIQTG